VFGFRRVLALFWPPIASSEANDHVLRGSTALWLMVFVVAALTEELWRALCISGFQQNGYSSLLADILPAFFFSIAHMSGLPSWIPSGLEIAGSEIIVGIVFGALFIWSGNFVSPCLSSLVFYTLTFFRMRPHHVFDSSMPRS
jgi:membrane protease YdiL (CAAX protease family)